MEQKDERMKMMNEILNGIKVSNKLIAISGALLLYLALVRLGFKVEFFFLLGYIFPLLYSGL